MEEMEQNLQIRKLLPSQVRELAQILETHELWKRLMNNIPKKLESSDNYVCDITANNHHKYNAEHFKLIENASEKYKKTCTEILLDEWGTSGRIRPTLGHLLYLLTKSNLFRAADYVADLLNLPKPKRPKTGPEALVRIDLSVSTEIDNDKEIERMLDDIDYPSAAVDLIRSNSAKMAKAKVSASIPKIVITPNEDEKSTEITFPVVVPKEKSTAVVKDSVSDMIIFSKSSVKSNNITDEESGFNSSTADNDSESFMPHITSLLNENPQNIPNFEVMDNSIKVEWVENKPDPIGSAEVTECFNKPALSQLLESVSRNLDANIPDLSALNHVISEEQSSNPLSEQNSNLLPDFDILKSEDNVPVLDETSGNFLPDFNILHSDTDESIKIITGLTPVSSDGSNKSRPCTSPLPNLTLNTLLPHFNYSELQMATNNFNEEHYVSESENGRFLGSGAFGSVFISFGLLDVPVAVKKLVLENVQVVNINDTVTKQFRNEVEVLSKYMHENLLSLLGYSCDGCTYCLLYEYIPGGSLKDRLQVTENKLQWKERLSIAKGTCNAVAYLHTAFSTPLIHRDIKSANILLDSSNNPKLCDFGLIKLSPSQNTSTATTVFGTCAYMAPEAFRGDISVKLDTFSFGVVLIELLTSLPPMDDSREGTDLVTHIREVCDDEDIMPLVDVEAGSWEEVNVNYAAELSNLAKECLEQKKKRPNMVKVKTILEDLTENILL